MKLEIALIGNPNSGKTSLFNELTGADQAVGNWTGVTIGLEVGHCRYRGYAWDIVDLPGIYSLFSRSPEQRTACAYLLNHRPDVVVNVVDATNLERNLYLTTQLIETGLHVVVALNMSDALAGQGLSLDSQALTRLLGVPCVRISATKRLGFQTLLDKVAETARQPRLAAVNNWTGRFPERIMAEIDALAGQLEAEQTPAWIDRRWLAQQMLAEHSQGERWQAEIGAVRYQIIQDILPQVLRKSPFKRRMFTRKIDAVVCHPVWALPVFLLVMLAVFYFSFGFPGSYLTEGLTWLLLDWLPGLLASLCAQVGVGPVLQSLVIDGIIGGVGGVLVFLPQLTILFFFLTLLEYSGYMARAAFVTDRLLARFGLSGMGFIPLVLGFGCSVPAIMATRALESRQERLLTMTVIPFISCGAKMPVYALFGAVFFTRGQSLVVFSLYLLGIVAGLSTAVILRPLIMKQDRPVFLMEMPPYRKPVWSSVGRSVWLRVRDFISRAGSMILIASIVIWFLNHFQLGVGYTATGAGSLWESLGRLLAPVFAPLGFGQGIFAVALITGFMAKEAVVSTLTVLLAGSAVGLGGLLTPPAAYAFLVFVLLYTPCVASLAALKRESGSRKFLVGYLGYQLAVAWLVSFLVYHLIRLFA